jgi:peptidoglycan/LPS O-acetylase OafA/YrhL
MTSPLIKKSYNLEILRGFAAVVVVVSHLFYWGYNFDKNNVSSYFKSFLPPAHFSLLIFFILSGYVIGLNHPERLVGRNIAVYLKKRFVRLYPIYILSILLALFIAYTHYPWGTILSNFVFTQNILSPVVFENVPAWSLSYEVAYYIFFIALSFFRIKTSLAMLLFFMLGFINLYFAINPTLVSYSFGCCFWLLGVFIARNLQKTESDLKLIPLLLYILGTGILLNDNYSVNRLIKLVIKLPNAYSHAFLAQMPIQMADLIFIPYGFIVVCFFAGRNFKYSNWFFFIIQIIPLFLIFTDLKHAHSFNYIVSTGVLYCILAGISYFIKIPTTKLSSLGIKLGSISYGIYIIHFPILYLFWKVIIFPQGSVFYILKMLLFLVVTIIAAWVLEKKYQPLAKMWLGKFFTKNSTKPLTVSIK